ncbi:hypothetical protein O3P69_016510 [Scylla paramamosain]|uniref:Uncharacterized protein n=1 Tax=Scylla paramamosain TaxID=85552 RepID=A0AAW0TEB6_SCYPA
MGEVDVRNAVREEKEGGGLSNSLERRNDEVYISCAPEIEHNLRLDDSKAAHPPTPSQRHSHQINKNSTKSIQLLYLTTRQRDAHQMAPQKTRGKDTEK